MSSLNSKLALLSAILGAASLHPNKSKRNRLEKSVIKEVKALRKAA